ncbi:MULTISPECIES: GreA/GreB family elongation factor [unclassified Sphingobacterium]|uniref:GreA/GreB family elongation factor n=1 Tax=unclassified Sphingobacterium TaxID=2609468 RepID=UPI0025DE4C36|nr:MULTISPECIES: GreA/GreB family elongation factor [unclassified Sphingobacterium]
MTNNYFDTKHELLEIALKRTNDRISMIASALETARDSSTDDTKSSAGDKYETSREMIQQDINRYQKQLLEANKDLQQLLNIQPVIRNETPIARAGSLVQTDVGFYFIATSIGAVKVGDSTIFIISPLSPIGQLLIGKKTGDSFVFNTVNQKVNAIY